MEPHQVQLIYLPVFSKWAHSTVQTLRDELFVTPKSLDWVSTSIFQKIEQDRKQSA